MNPWLWFWAPQFHFPLSGSVAQRIDPDTSWFFDGIAPESGDAQMEKQIFEVASYGRQLGWLTELVLAQGGSENITPAKAEEARARLEAVRGEAEQIKHRSRARLADQAEHLLEKLADSDPEGLARVLGRFSPAPVPALTPALPAPTRRLR